MLVLVALCLTAIALATPLARLTSSSPVDRQAVLNAKAAVHRKFDNAPAILAGPAYSISTALQLAYDRASDFATNMSLLSVLSNSSPLGTSSIRLAVASAGNYSIPLKAEIYDGRDLEYYGSLAFGSQAQPLVIDFDTGSADLWVPVDCHQCGGLSEFNANASSTYRNMGKPFFAAYGSGAVDGTLAQDTVSLGPLQVPNQTMGAVRSVSPNFSDNPSDGLAGLAFSSIAKSGAPTLFENLIPQLEAPLFSFYLTRGKVDGAQLYLGGIDMSMASEDTISWAPVVSKTYWTVAMTGTSVNGKPVETNGTFDAIIDTGTSFIYGPTHIVDAIYRQIPGSAPAPDFGSGFYSYPCNATIEVSFTLDTHALPLDPRDFNLGWFAGDTSRLTCIGAIIGTETLPFFILGDSFLKGYVSIFDYAHGARVGFLKSIQR